MTKKKTKDIFDLSPAELSKQAKQISGTSKAPPAKKASTKAKKKGRPALPQKRVPFTTSLTNDNLKALKIAAVNAGKRPADLLNEILSKHFKT